MRGPGKITAGLRGWLGAPQVLSAGSITQVLIGGETIRVAMRAVTKFAKTAAVRHHAERRLEHQEAGLN